MMGLNTGFCLGCSVLEYNPFKCIYTRTVHRGRQHMKNCRFVQCTEADFGGLTDHEQHRKTRETDFIFSLSHVPVTVIMYQTQL